MKAIQGTLQYVRSGGGTKEEVGRTAILLHQIVSPDEYSQKQTARQLGLTEARVSQLLKSNCAETLVFREILKKCLEYSCYMSWDELIKSAPHWMN